MECDGEDRGRTWEEYAGEIKEWVEVGIRVEEPEGSEPGEDGAAEMTLDVTWWQGKRVIEDESVERERRERSTEDGGEKDTLERCMDEMGGGEGKADEGKEGEGVMEEKEGGEELHTGTADNTPEEKHDQPELSLNQHPGKEKLTSLCVVVAIS